MLYHVHLTMSGFKLTLEVIIGTDCTGSCKSNYHMIMIMTAPFLNSYPKLHYILIMKYLFN